ncbi:MAG: site-specific integrase [Prevotellaceae bacterium]|jgi:site-specific recombinase XerD|nr:site-specific integrase [Prevotellaceae bacterium]
MRNTFKILFYLKRDKQKANGHIPLFCRITVDGKEVRFGMKKDVNPKYWDAKAGKATGRTDEAVEINTLIDNTKSAIYRVHRDLQERESIVTAERVKNSFLGLDAKHQNLLELFDRHNEERKLLTGKNISEATYDKYRITRSHLACFIREWYNLSDIPLKDINHKFICDFKVFMTASRGCMENTAARYMQFFKHIIIVAIKLGWIDKNPFSEYKIQIRKTDRGYLTQDEVELLMQQTFESKRLERVRDTFVFCCFTGLSYIDVKNLTSDHIGTSFDGKLWITGKRGKTDVGYNVPLLDIPKMILEKYKNTLPDGCLLPVVNNQNTNAYLKEIGELCGIKKKLTFHLSRHTFATLTLSKGVSIESVSKMLGHTNIQTTQIYARITNEKIGNDMTVFAGKIKKMETNLVANIKNIN